MTFLSFTCCLFHVNWDPSLVTWPTHLGRRTRQVSLAKMSFEVFAFILAILISIALIFFAIWNVSMCFCYTFDHNVDYWGRCCLIVFQIIAFDDLKTDYKNPVDLCNNLNPVCWRCFVCAIALLLNRVISGKNWEKLRLILWTSFWKLVVVGALSHR